MEKIKIDDESDHCERTVNVQRVFDMMDKARRTVDGAIVRDPVFIWRYYPEGDYDRCVCGHNIVHNYIATCVQTGKYFIVGSDCIITVCERNKWNNIRKCQYCDVREPLKSQNHCKECLSALKKCDKILKSGKYRGKTFYEIFKLHPSYIEQINAYDRCDISAESATLINWVYVVKETPYLLKKYEGDNVKKKLEIEEEIVRKKSIEEAERLGKEKVFLKVKYEEKEFAKAIGLKWGPDCKSWFTIRSKLNNTIANKFLPHDSDTQKRFKLIHEHKYDGLF